MIDTIVEEINKKITELCCTDCVVCQIRITKEIQSLVSELVKANRRYTMEENTND